MIICRIRCDTAVAVAVVKPAAAADVIVMRATAGGLPAMVAAGSTEVGVSWLVILVAHRGQRRKHAASTQN